MATVSIIYFSGSGHTTKLAEAIQKGAASVSGVKTNLLAISGDDITKGRYKNDDILGKLDASDAIVFGSPTYMGGPAANSRPSRMRRASGGLARSGRTSWPRASLFRTARAATSLAPCNISIRWRCNTA